MNKHIAHKNYTITALASFLCLLSYNTLLHAESSSWSSHISTLVQTTDSLALKLFFVLILGLLLSLTPCIYPMIPITVGILQAQSSTSVLRNLLPCTRLFNGYRMHLCSTRSCCSIYRPNVW